MEAKAAYAMPSRVKTGVRGGAEYGNAGYLCIDRRVSYTAPLPLHCRVAVLLHPRAPSAAPAPPPPLPPPLHCTALTVSLWRVAETRSI